MHGASPFHAKLLAYVQPIKVAIMRHGSTWISSIGAALNHIMMSKTDEFYSKSVLRRTITASRKGASAVSWATIRSLHERATICTCMSPCAKICTSSRSDLMTFRGRIQEQPCSMETCLSSMLSFHVSFSFALNTHRAQNPSRTPRHGVVKITALHQCTHVRDHLICFFLNQGNFVTLACGSPHSLS